MSFGFGFSRPANFYGGYLWTPQIITTDLWLDASDASTITLNGSTVSQWSDKSGNNRHFTQATAASQPGYSTGALNNLPILTFDGVDDFLDGGNILPATDGITAFIIARQNTIGTATSAPFFGRGSSVSVNGQWYIRGLLSSQPNFGSVAAASVSSTVSATRNDVADTGWHLYGMRWSPVNGNLYAFRDGFSGAAAGISGTPGDPALSCRIAARSGGAITFQNMNIAEVVVVLEPLALSSLTRFQIEAYLAWKYALQGNLPGNHPYKNLPPTI